MSQNHVTVGSLEAAIIAALEAGETTARGLTNAIAASDYLTGHGTKPAIQTVSTVVKILSSKGIVVWNAETRPQTFTLAQTAVEVATSGHSNLAEALATPAVGTMDSFAEAIAEALAVGSFSEADSLEAEAEALAAFEAAQVEAVHADMVEAGLL
jgi:predicted transcriptional regulator